MHTPTITSSRHTISYHQLHQFLATYADHEHFQNLFPKSTCVRLLLNERGLITNRVEASGHGVTCQGIPGPMASAPRRHGVGVSVYTYTRQHAHIATCGA